jgi:isopenicillin N synthase-like dioxygenase
VSASAIEPVSFTLYSKDFDRFAQALGASFQRYGFAVISDHDMAQARIDAAIADAKAFFALPEEIKKQYAGSRAARAATSRSASRPPRARPTTT